MPTDRLTAVDHSVDFQILLDTFMDLNDSGRALDKSPEYFRGGFELLVNACPYQVGGHDQTRLVVASLLYAHDDWFDPSRRPFDFV